MRINEIWKNCGKKQHEKYSRIEFPIFILFSDLENVSSRAIFENVNAQVELWTKFMTNVFVNVTVLSEVMPKSITLFYDYFSDDVDDIIYQLPFPIW